MFVIVPSEKPVDFQRVSFVLFTFLMGEHVENERNSLFSRQFDAQNQGGVLGKDINLHRNKQTEMADFNDMFKYSCSPRKIPKVAAAIGFVCTALLAMYWILIFAADFDLSWVFLTIVTVAHYLICIAYSNNTRKADWKTYLFYSVLVADVILIVACAFFLDVWANTFFPGFLTFFAIILLLKVYTDKGII